MAVTTRTRLTRRATIAGLALLASAGLAACGKDANNTVGPRLPGEPEPFPGVRNAAFIVDVNTRTRQVRITPAQSGLGGPAGDLALNSSIRGALQAPTGIRGSILAGDVVQLTSSNYVASGVGEFQPGKVRVSVDINITNRLGGVDLVTPTFPTPPAGVTGILLFPFETSVTVTSGGTSVGGDGTEVIFEQPSYGAVESSIDWDGAPHNFFNDASCAAADNDCYRYEAFPELAANGTSAPRRIGFDIDPTVGSFRARLIIAADLRNAGPARFTTVRGTIASPQLGPVAGARVVVSGGSAADTAFTDATGTYVVDSISSGPRTIVVSNLPAGCTAPASQSFTSLAANDTLVRDFSVTCPVPSGTVSGSVLSSLGGGATGTQVIITPTGGSALAPVTVSAAGAFSVAGVPVGVAGTGTIALANIPAGCTNPGPQPYSGLVSGGSVSASITLVCVAPPALHTYSATWSAVSGGQVTLTLRFDPSTRNDPNVNGAAADDFTGISGDIQYPASRLTFVSAANGAGSPFAGITANSSVPGTISWLNFTTAGPQTASQIVAVFTFSVSGTGPISLTQSLSEIVSDVGDLYDLSFVQIINPTLTP